MVAFAAVPSAKEASMTRKAFTVSEYALNLVRVKHDHVANNITFAAPLVRLGFRPHPRMFLGWRAGGPEPNH